MPTVSNVKEKFDRLEKKARESLAALEKKWTTQVKGPVAGLIARLRNTFDLSRRSELTQELKNVTAKVDDLAKKVERLVRDRVTKKAA